MIRHFKTEEELEDLVNGFENCTLAKEGFTHREHLAVAVWYLKGSNTHEALEKMRGGLLRFLGHHQIGLEKYKEDLTMFWLELIQDTIESSDRNLTTLELTNRVIDCLGDSKVPTVDPVFPTSKYTKVVVDTENRSTK